MLRCRPQLIVGIIRIPTQRCHSTTSQWHLLPCLDNAEVDAFRQAAYIPSRPVKFQAGSFPDLTACQKWFISTEAGTSEALLDHQYMSAYASTIVPLELTTDDGQTFTRAEAPLGIFLDWCQMAVANSNVPLTSRFYLAQAALAALPADLKSDLPVPEIVQKAGSGDVYDANLWMGVPPTYTPLHRDPNPNLFVQLAGKKKARLIPPVIGDAIFARVQTRLGRKGTKAFRGEEMMQGREREMLDREVWGSPIRTSDRASEAKVEYEVLLEPGSGIFIPKGWWHSIKGIEFGITASVNWWFR